MSTPAAPPKTVKLTIDGKAVEVPAGTSVFNAAAKAGIFIPHYCYHPDLSIAGVCRMCMVDIEKIPRLQISCNTVVAEGMIVRTNTDKVKDTVKGVLELHLINHPLDCPICDKAGECKLQDFYRDYGLYESRMDFEKVHKPKVQDIGTIVLDAERCILCTRCVRFTAEVTKTNELGIFNRGDRSVLTTYDDGPLHNHYTGNLADICPVGALTAKDFRFKQRVWFLEKTASTCGMCAHGCSTEVSINPDTRQLYRVEPRRNPEVNRSWICDTGRWDYHYVTAPSRLRIPKVQRDGVWIDSTWMECFGTLKAEIEADPGTVLVALGTQMTNEEIAEVAGTLHQMGVGAFTWLVDEAVVGDRKPFDGILRHKDETPNALGFETVMRAMKVPWLKQAEALKRAGQGGYRWVLLLGLEGEAMPGASAFVAGLPKGIAIAAHATSAAPWLSACAWSLPGVSAFEKSGTFVSGMGRVQRVQASLPAQYTGRDGYGLALGLRRGDDREQALKHRHREIFDSTLAGALGLSGAAWKTLAPLGVPSPAAKEAHA